MDVQVFGPLQAVVEGRPVPLGGVKPRALLAMLALNAGSRVSSERLIEGLWGENQPATATKLVHASATWRRQDERSMSSRQTTSRPYRSIRSGSWP
jgi:DNA-binding SARP family transcriptional activator